MIGTLVTVIGSQSITNTCICKNILVEGYFGNFIWVWHLKYIQISKAPHTGLWLLLSFFSILYYTPEEDSSLLSSQMFNTIKYPSRRIFS